MVPMTCKGFQPAVFSANNGSMRAVLLGISWIVFGVFRVGAQDVLPVVEEPVVENKVVENTVVRDTKTVSNEEDSSLLGGAKQKSEGVTFVSLDPAIERISRGEDPKTLADLKALQSQQSKVAEKINLSFIKLW